jgi:hypothetical protein
VRVRASVRERQSEREGEFVVLDYILGTEIMKILTNKGERGYENTARGTR